MTYKQIKWNDLPITIRLSCYRAAKGVAEFHAMINIDNAFGNAAKQFHILEEAVQRLITSPEMEGVTLVWKRFFLSDAVNQAPFLKQSNGEAVSVVQQQPLNGSKASLLLYFAENVQLSIDTDGTAIMKRPDYEHLFHTQLHEQNGDVIHQTCKVFDEYSHSLFRKGCTLERNCIRTWIFVQDVDVQYAGMVSARRAYFEREGLTKDTHYIASTGIEGRYIHPEVLMLIDAYAVANITPAQIKYLHAYSHLNSTYEYGVTFERGTTVDYGDRRHIFISGTASIDNRGEIVHPMDIDGQIVRMFENIQALLTEAEASMKDVAHMIVYLRDTADYAVAHLHVRQYYPNVPHVFILAPVCRPGWLVEVECMAVKTINDSRFASF